MTRTSANAKQISVVFLFVTLALVAQEREVGTVTDWQDGMSAQVKVLPAEPVA